MYSLIFLPLSITKDRFGQDCGLTSYKSWLWRLSSFLGFSSLTSWRLGKEGDVASLPVVDDGAAHIVNISLTAFFELSSAFGNLCDEIFSISPSVHSKDVSDVLLVDLFEDWLNIGLWIRDAFRAHHSLEHLVSIRFTLIIDNTWAVDEIDALRQRDVLPNLGLTGNWGNLTAGLLHERVDDGGFTNIGIANESNRDTLLLLVQHVELLE